MRDPKWMGTSPSAPFWDKDGKTLYFGWNPNKETSDSLYFISLQNHTPLKATVLQKQNLVDADQLVYNLDRSAYVYSKDGDIFYENFRHKIKRKVTQTLDFESSPKFSFNGSKIIYSRNQNLYAWDILNGETIQLTNIKNESSSPPAPMSRNAATLPKAAVNTQEDWLKNDQLKYFEVLRQRKDKREAAEKYEKDTRQKELRSISIDDRTVQSLNISPDGRFVTYSLVKRGNSKPTIIPSYVTESGFTTESNGRTKVGNLQSQSDFYFYDRIKDTIYQIKTDSIPGIKDIPMFMRDYPQLLAEKQRKDAKRDVSVYGPTWSPKGKYAVLDIRSADNKDRWLVSFDTASSRLHVLNRQHDEAWIGGPGINSGNVGWLDDETFWFQSEATGYSHIYASNLKTHETHPITKGAYEVQEATLSADKKYFYLVTNQVHPGEQQLYRLNISNGNSEQLTGMTGANQVTISPDEKHVAIIYSYSNKPWELYIQENRASAKPQQITFKAQSEEFKTYQWRDPELVTFKAEDGATVYARVYKPSTPNPNKPAVLFVHGAGYLQNAHKWWSSYFREYMFNNLLADNGYYVMDIDYRASSGYGRDWRTGIYRHMGGKDLTDNIDGVKFMVQNYGVNPGHVGLYGGSYGGFITLMALFTKPGVFAAGAALRPVTDWANYNHGYTANILNEPFNDSLAYRNSSPLYFAEGLKDHLLICHGMVDVNVHFQDAVKLSQRLIELGKDNWQLAPYPMEDHGFLEPSSWTDEYKRIFNLFETVLKK
jgi:dipeptidyl aminopeptidase/acylaminoacyl peptidase